MHDTAYETGRLFFSRYLADLPQARVLELGSQNVNGGLRDFALPGWTYVGLDMVAGAGVDAVVSPGAHLPFADQTFDAVVASSVLEHDPFFWRTFLEMARVLKSEGFLYASAPSNGAFHRYPRDYWRFYPDAAVALGQWAQVNGIELGLVEAFVGERRGDIWNDFVAVYCRGQVDDRIPERLISTEFPHRNLWRAGAEDVSLLEGRTEDMRLIDSLRAELARERTRSEALRSRLAAPPIGGFRGCLDQLSDGTASGWVMQDWAPDRRLTVEVWRDGVVVARGSAEAFRPDLLAAGHGDGSCAFTIGFEGPPDGIEVLAVSETETFRILPAQTATPNPADA